jgi:hypothetical protein
MRFSWSAVSAPSRCCCCSPKRFSARVSSAALARVVGQPLRQRAQAFVGALGERVEPLAEAVDAPGLLRRHPGQLLADVAAETVEALLQLLAAGALLLAQRALQAFVVVLQRVEARVQAMVAGPAQQQDKLQEQHQQDGGEDDGGQEGGGGHERFPVRWRTVYVAASQILRGGRSRGFSRSRA